MTTLTSNQGWAEKSLLDLVTIKSGQVDPRAPEYRDLPLIAPDHLSSRTGRLIKLETAAVQGAISGKYLVKPGDVIYSKIRPYLQKAYRCDFVALCSADMYPFTPKAGVDASFVLHTVLGHDFTKFATSVSARSGIPKINREELAEYRMTVPPRGELAAIGRALDDTDDMIDALGRLIAKKQAIKQGTIQQLLTGRTRLPGFTEPWRVRSLGSVGKCIRGVGYDPGLDLSTGDRPYTVRLLRSNNVQESLIDVDGLQFVHERRVRPDQILKRNDIVICMANGSRALVGKSALFNQADGRLYTFGAFMGAFRAISNEASPKYVAALLNTHAFRSWLDVILSGSSINNLRPRDVEGFTCQMPSLEEQGAIAKVLNDIDVELINLRSRLAKASAIKTGMTQQLLTGRTRLSVEVKS